MSNMCFEKQLISQRVLTNCGKMASKVTHSIILTNIIVSVQANM